MRQTATKKSVIFDIYDSDEETFQSIYKKLKDADAVKFEVYQAKKLPQLREYSRDFQSRRRFGGEGQSRYGSRSRSDGSRGTGSRFGRREGGYRGSRDRTNKEGDRNRPEKGSLEALGKPDHFKFKPSNIDDDEDEDKVVYSTMGGKVSPGSRFQ